MPLVSHGKGGASAPGLKVPVADISSEGNRPRSPSVVLNSSAGGARMIHQAGTGTGTGTGTGKYEQMLVTCKNMKPIPTAVAHPCEESALSGAIEAANLGIIIPILVGPREKIESTARSVGIDLTSFQIVDTPHSNASAAKAVELVRQAQAELLMKGSLHTDELMAAVVSREGGLRTARRISHVFVMDVPTYHKVLFVTDGAINIAPTLEDKADICQNAVDLIMALGLKRPKVA